jgi:subtilisin-like proprotein convertase family protein
MYKSTPFNLSKIIRIALSIFLLASILIQFQPSHEVTKAQVPEPVEGTEGIYQGVSTAVKFDISPPLRDIPPAQLDPNFTFEDHDLPWGLEGPLGPQDIDPIVQSTVGSLDIPDPIINFDGFDNQLTYTPPDPVGDVGPNHYVAMSNVHFAVFDKTGNTLYGPVPNNTLWAGFGGDCQTDNSGDPIVVYDQMADRWMLTQFTSSGPTYFNCVALSTTGDPTGTYYRWAFSTGINFPDYPKYGVWPDAYYISTREFGSPNGIGAYALERDEMLIGNPSPQVVSFLVTPNYLAGHGLLPADLDGSELPPPDSPQYFMGTMDDGGPLGAPQDAITVWKFFVDWVTPGNSTFTNTDIIPVAPFDSIYPCSPGSRDCIPQPGTSEKIDILSYRQRPLWRLAYRNYGTHESLVTNQSVEASTNMAGIRWYEVRSPDSSPFIYQQGTYAPGITDGIHRWMGSIAMDSAGNMALGYSASNATTTYPSVWYTGRLASDPLGTMPQGEGVIVNGGGSQLSTGSRWGDYTSMNIDPVDDCTFWYINEYYPVTHSTEWYLRIGAFKFPSCEPGDVADLSIEKTGTPELVVPGNPITYTLSSTNNGPGSSPKTLTNPEQIDINVSGPATPYPSTIDASALEGKILSTTVTLHNINHTYPDDIDVLLVAPSGENTILMSDAGSGYDLIDVTLTFDDIAPGPLPDSSQITSGSYQPTNYGIGDNFPVPAPTGPYSVTLSAFNGISPTGIWSLYIVDDVGGDAGNVADGWDLTLVFTDAVTVNDYLPDDVTVTGISAPGWTCDQVGQLITCTTEEIPIGPLPDIVINADSPSATGYITNTATITSSFTDPNPENNTSSSMILVNTPPIAVDDEYSTDEDTALIVEAPGVIDNDIDPDPDPLSVTLESDPGDGTVLLDINGSFVYTPTTNFDGLDTFTYILNDGYLTSTATVSITVTAINDPPIGVDDFYSTLEDTTLFVEPPGVLTNDIDYDNSILTSTVELDPAFGTLVLGLDGGFVYTPTTNFNGIDGFTYIVSDGELTDTAQVTITVEPVNDQPIVDAGEDQIVDEGELVYFEGSFIDPGLLVRLQQDEYIHWNFGDGTTVTGTLTPSHTYLDNGVYTVTLTITDTELGVGSDELVVTANNVPPSLANLPDQSVLVNETITITGVFTDPGILDSQTVVIEWLPGITELINIPASIYSFEASYIYTEPGNYPVTVTITDKDGGTDTQSFNVFVDTPFKRVYLPIISR